MFVTGGALLLPSCLQSAKDTIIKYKHFDLTQAQIMLVASLSEAVLPLSGTPQASLEKLHLFVIKMVDDCLAPEDQQCFVSGIIELQNLVKEKYKSYPYLNGEDGTSVIAKLEKQEFSENVLEFYKIFKRQLINGYLSSAYFMKHVIEYKLIPGSYQVHVPVI
jgi:hypothetical protein